MTLQNQFCCKGSIWLITVVDLEFDADELAVKSRGFDGGGHAGAVKGGLVVDEKKGTKRQMAGLGQGKELPLGAFRDIPLLWLGNIFPC